MEPLFKNPQPTSGTGRWAQLLGAFFLVDGVWGLFSPVTFGVLSTNTTHAVIHLLLGVAGLYFGTRATMRAARLHDDASAARGYVGFVGVLLGVVGVAYFVPGLRDVLVDLLNLNSAVAVLNLFVGGLSLIVAGLSGRRLTSAEAPPAGDYARVEVPSVRTTRFAG